MGDLSKKFRPKNLLMSELQAGNSSELKRCKRFKMEGQEARRGVAKVKESRKTSLKRLSTNKTTRCSRLNFKTIWIFATASILVMTYLCLTQTRFKRTCRIPSQIWTCNPNYWLKTSRLFQPRWSMKIITILKTCTTQTHCSLIILAALSLTRIITIIITTIRTQMSTSWLQL